jgi:hypothetical protein
VLFWALVSRDCRETVEIYCSRSEAFAELAAALRDEPSWRDDLKVTPLELASGSEPSLN